MSAIDALAFAILIMGFAIVWYIGVKDADFAAGYNKCVSECNNNINTSCLLIKPPAPTMKNWSGEFNGTKNDIER